MERLARQYGTVANFVAVCVNGLVAYPPQTHPEAGQRGKEWPRLKATELAERVGLQTPVHAYVDVTDKGDHLVAKLGLQTLPTHVLVDSLGQVVSVLARKELPTGLAVEALVAAPPARAPVCVPCTGSTGGGAGGGL